jgi:hypothetical protein
MLFCYVSVSDVDEEVSYIVPNIVHDGDNVTFTLLLSALLDLNVFFLTS